MEVVEHSKIIHRSTHVDPEQVISLSGGVTYFTLTLYVGFPIIDRDSYSKHLAILNKLI